MFLVLMLMLIIVMVITIILIITKNATNNTIYEKKLKKIDNKLEKNRELAAIVESLATN
jgi:energy-converting hydrogenase Eha subunit H